MCWGLTEKLKAGLNGYVFVSYSTGKVSCNKTEMKRWISILILWRKRSNIWRLSQIYQYRNGTMWLNSQCLKLVAYWKFSYFLSTAFFGNICMTSSHQMKQSLLPATVVSCNVDRFVFDYFSTVCRPVVKGGTGVPCPPNGCCAPCS